MFNIFGNKPSRQNNRISALQFIDALYEQEMQTNLAALAERRRKSRLRQSAIDWAEYWPFAVGMAISCFVPQMRDFADAYRPWGMWILFPFASIANRPEIAQSNQFVANMPLLFMFVQYPIEGILARIALRGKVTGFRVFGQVLFLHLFALVELWLVSSPLTR